MLVLENSLKERWEAEIWISWHVIELFFIEAYRKGYSLFLYQVLSPLDILFSINPNFKFSRNLKEFQGIPRNS